MRRIRTTGLALSALLATALLAAPPALAAPGNHPSKNTAWLIAVLVIIALVLLSGFLWLGRTISRGRRSDHFRH